NRESVGGGARLRAAGYRSLAWGVLRDLGPSWALFRLGYGLKQWSGWQSVRTPMREWSDRPLRTWLRPGAPSEPVAYKAWRQNSGPNFFFTETPRLEDPGLQHAVTLADELLSGRWRYFDHHDIRTGFPPDWHRNPFDGHRAPERI